MTMVGEKVDGEDSPGARALTPLDPAPATPRLATQTIEVAVRESPQELLEVLQDRGFRPMKLPNSGVLVFDGTYYDVQPDGVVVWTPVDDLEDPTRIDCVHLEASRHDDRTTVRISRRPSPSERTNSLVSTLVIATTLGLTALLAAVAVMSGTVAPMVAGLFGVVPPLLIAALVRASTRRRPPLNGPAAVKLFEVLTPLALPESPPWTPFR